MLMKEGQLVLTDTEFSRRVIFENKILQINSLTTADTGTFQFTDKEDNLAMSVEVKVISGEPQTFLFYTETDPKSV